MFPLKIENNKNIDGPDLPNFFYNVFSQFECNVKRQKHLKEKQFSIQDGGVWR
jgi:hypothetical protein